MERIAFALGFVVLAMPCCAQDPNLAAILGFENQQSGTMPAGWGGGPPGTIFLQGDTVHSGKWAVRLERTESSARDFSTIGKDIPIEFTGKAVELRGFLRTENVTGYAGLWLREDGDTPNLALDNMQEQHLKGTTEWHEYSITLPLHAEAKLLVVGVLVSGTGKLWADDLQILVDGKPIGDAPRIERPKTPNDLDHKFDKGSGITITQLSPVQIDNLATLAKVWGFLKYHHPEITSGKHQWDYDLFRILPAILAAPNRKASNSLLLKWIDDLGPVHPCDPCAKLKEDDLALQADVRWISDATRLGGELSSRLTFIRANRRPAQQFYVSLAPYVGNPKFENELSYAGAKFPDSGFQLLALFRHWNIIQYWSPNRVAMGSDWDAILTDSIPKLALAKDMQAYRRELLALIAKVNDTHANLWNGLDARPPGQYQCELPVTTRFIENQAVVTGYYAAEPGKASGLIAGDVISDLDGVAVAELVKTWTPYYADSNEAARLRDMSDTLTSGDCEKPVAVRARRGSEVLNLTVPRMNTAGNAVGHTHDLPGDALRLLSDDIAYIKLSAIKGRAQDLGPFIKSAAKTKGLIIDIRNYPAEFVVFTLGALLITDETPFARFTEGDLSNPGAFHWTVPQKLQPEQPHYSGKIVILVDEITQSSAEYHTMAFRAAPGAVVIGSTTAGADGNVSQIPLPGALRTMISGIGVFYPDKRPTQRLGIVPDKEVKPTIAGIRDGRDEVLEAAMHEILGPEASILNPNGDLKDVRR